ncbi:MCE family protein [Mycolicibacillus trivialis]|uniref:Mammalian cell entry protein n=1 Tax=Mycolicibacillus trivialis TaxID=1798 RepID=A0A1X2EJT4_9MYCO|nr:MCE family protein [Mycolicibacillus trivialis]ORX03122.1 mammalian cell entry protein [Mycolicibacillus trivialis]
MSATRWTARLRRAGVLATAGLLLAGCQFGGLNSLNMPGTKGHGKGSYNIWVQVPDVATLPQNSPVMIDDVTVGSVSGVQAVQRPDGTFYALLQLSLEGDVDLPANAIARVAQTSLLGSQHVALAEPEDTPPIGRLSEGSEILLTNSDRYPTTEEVLASLGMVVNNGNLGALQDVTEEMYAAVVGRTEGLNTLIPRLAELTGSLEQQTGDIIAALDGLNRFSGKLAANKEHLGNALESLPGALGVLNENSGVMVDAFTALGRMGEVAARVLSETKEDFVADLIDMYPVVKSFADNADNLVGALPIILTFPFTSYYIKNAVRGDYLNVFVTFDLTLRRLGETVFTTSALDPNMQHLSEVVNPPDYLIGAMANLSGQAANPFEIPPKNGGEG